MSAVRAAALVALAAGVVASPAQARWSKPALLVSGDDAGLTGAGARADGGLRTAIADAPRRIALGIADLVGPSTFAAPTKLIAGSATVGDVGLAADGSGVALRYSRPATSAVTFDAAGTLGAPVELPGGRYDAAAISPAGSAVLAGLRTTAAGVEVVAAVRDGASGAFSAPVRIGYAASSDTLLDAGIGDRGEAVVTWQENGFPSAVAAAVRLPGAVFSKATFVTRDASLVDLAVGPGGQAILAAPGSRRLRVSIKRPGAATMPPVRTVDSAAQSYDASVAAAGSSRVAVGWIAGPRPSGDERMRVYAGSASLRRVGTVGHSAGDPIVGIAADGGLTAAWNAALPTAKHDPTARSQLGVAYRPASGGAFEPTTLNGPVALDSTPEAVVSVPGGRSYVLDEAFEPSEARNTDGFRRVYMTEHTP